MRFSTTLLLTAALALGCSSGNGNNSGSAGSSGSAADGAGGSATGGAGGSATGGSGGSAAGGAGGAGGDTYANFAQGFFETYCVPCHDSNDPNRDYSSMTDILRDKDVIRCGVATVKFAECPSFPPPRQFPIGTGAKPTDTERDRLVAWIEAGLPQ